MDELEAATITLQRTVEEIMEEVKGRLLCAGKGSTHYMLRKDEFDELAEALAGVHGAAERAAFNEAPLVPGAHKHVGVTTPDGQGTFCRICRAELT